MRITENMKFNAAANSIFLSQSKYTDLMEQISSEKRINRPSDDPVGARMVLDYKSTKYSIEQYQRNLDAAKGWVTMTETKLGSVRDILVNAREIAVSQGSANSSAESRQVAAASVQQLIDEIRGLANAQYNGQYLFAGSRTDTEPFSETARTAASIGTVQAGTLNTFDGNVASGGAYAGAVNKDYVVKIVSTGTLATATYAVSADGGKTWGATQTDLSAPVTIGDGITLSFTAGAHQLTANDVFHVQAHVTGYYNGNGENLAVNIGEGASVGYNISGESIFTDQGNGTTNLFQVLDDLKTALENNNSSGVGEAITGLANASDSVNLHISECGTKTNRLELAGTSLTALNDETTQLLSNTEDADVAQVIMEFKQRELALQASYQLASTVGQISILNFLD